MIGGPNGAGKTTSSYMLMPELVRCYEYINADAIAASLSAFNPDKIAIQAGRLMLARINELAHLNVNFAFETTMASRSFAKFLLKCKEIHYQINLIFVWVSHVELAIQRVRHRVLSGGHNIPVETIKRRYYRSMANFKNLYLPLADSWLFCDNSSLNPIIVAKKPSAKESPIIFNQTIWNMFNELVE